ncbi:DNA translocase FtsK 4TM domain-containing protein, partial [bacterium]|nr:DNA translocase FtsK 4TM domain-containing protein [bacterium]
MSRKPIKVSRQEEILGILLMTMGMLIFLSLFSYNPQEVPQNARIGDVDNQLGIAGVYIAHFLNHYVLGRPSFVIPLIILMLGWGVFRGTGLSNTFRWSGYLLIFAVYTSVILAIPQISSVGADTSGGSLSGLIGTSIAHMLFDYLGVLGSIVVLLAIMVVTAIGVTNMSISSLLNNLTWRTTALFVNVQNRIKKARKLRKAKAQEKRSALDIKVDWRDTANEAAVAEAPEPAQTVQPPRLRPQLEIAFGGESNKGRDAGAEPSEEIQERPPIGNYVFPPFDLLADPPATESFAKEELFASAQVLEDTLLEFGVQGKVIDIKPGPVITRFEVEPAPGVKISRISGLSDDLALAMRAKRIRIVAPIPGKAAVGIEIPNRTHATVSFKEVLSCERFQQSDSPLTIALGKTIAGEPYVVKLDEMPHLLIAGATGSGKSVCLNCVIASLLYKAHPTELQLVMIDPKRLELSIYNNLRSHHLTYREDLDEEVVTTPANAISVLRSLEAVMDQRYEILARAGVRNIRDYNTRLKNDTLPMPDEQQPWEPLEYLVIIVDEL